MTVEECDERLDARYEVRTLLGAGGMSRVLRARDRVRGEDVALKILLPETADARLADEFRYIASLDHPGVIGVHDFGVTGGGRPYFTMELLDGPEFLDFARNEPFVLSIAALRSVVDTLAFVHARGVLHCDIKPSNIIVHRTLSGRRVPKLLDFGIAREAGGDEERLGGTIYYMAPEALDQQQQTPRSDLYSVGVLLFQLLTGRVPFAQENLMQVFLAHVQTPAPDPRDLSPDSPGPLAEITLRLLEKSPKNRFADAYELRDALDGWLESPDVAPQSRGSLHFLTPPAHLIAGQPRFVGHEAAMGQLLRQAGALAQERGSLHVVHGEAGSGRSLFLDELRVRAQLAGVACYLVDLDGSNTPVEPLRRIAASIAGASRDAAVLTALSAIGEQADDLADPDSDFQSSEVPLAEVLLSAAEELGASCARLAGDRPYALLLDNVEDVAPDATAALRSLAEGLAEHPVMFVAAGRTSSDETTEALLGLPDVSAVELQALSRDATARVITSLLGELSDAAAVCDHVYRESGGNPAAVVRVVRVLVASGALIEYRGRWRIAEELVGQLPSLSEEVGLRRIARDLLAPLEPRQQRAAEAAAWIGESSDPELVAAAIGATDPAIGSELVRQLLRELADAHLIEPLAAAGEELDRPRLRFTRRATRDLLLEGVSEADRELWSQAVAQELERRREQDQAVPLDELARHLRAAGRRADAIACGRAAAIELARAGAVGEAATAVRQVLSLLEEGPGGRGANPGEWARLASWLGDLERRRGNIEAAIGWYERVTMAPPDPNGHSTPRQIAARRKLGDLLFERGEAALGEEMLRHALDEARAAGDAALVGRAAYTIGWHLSVVGRGEESAELVEEALRAAETGGEALLKARSLKLRSTLHRYRGDLEQAERDARSAVDVHRELGKPRATSEALGALGNLEWGRGHLTEARAAYNEALKYARRAQWLTGIGKLHNGLAIVAWRSDDWDDARDHWRSALAIAHRTGNSVERAVLHNNLGMLAVRRGQFDAAGAAFREALGVVRKAGVQREEARILGNMGELAQLRGDTEEARQHLEASLRLASEVNALGVELEVRRNLLELELHAGGDPLRIGDRAQELSRRAEGLRAEVELVRLRRIRGRALAEAGQKEQAERLLQEAHDEFERLGYGYEAARLVRIAAELAGRGLLGGGGIAKHLAEARRLFRKLRAQPELERARLLAPETTPLGRLREQARAMARDDGAQEEDLRLAAPGDASVGPRQTAAHPPAWAEELPRRVFELTWRLTETRDIDELLSRIIEEARDLVGARRGFVILCDEDGQPAPKTARVSGEATSLNIEALCRTVVAQVLQTWQPAGWGETAAADGEVTSEAPAPIVCVPLIGSQYPIGALYLDSPEPFSISYETVVDLLEGLARQSAALLENARTLQEQRRKNALLATVAQELRNPLEAVLGYGRLLEDYGTVNEEGREYAAIVVSQAGRLDAMLSNLLDLSALEVSELDWSMVSIQVKDLLATAVQLVEPLARMRTVDLEIAMQPELPTLYGNRDRLVQALTNVLACVVKASGRGRILISARAAQRGIPGEPTGLRVQRPRDGTRSPPTFELSEQETVLVEVAHSGPITSPSVVEAFFDAPHRATPEGDALGLAVARDIAELHGGRLRAVLDVTSGRRVMLEFPALIRG